MCGGSLGSEDFATPRSLSEVADPELLLDVRGMLCLELCTPPLDPAVGAAFAGDRGAQLELPHSQWTRVVLSSLVVNLPLPDSWSRPQPQQMKDAVID